MIRDLKCAGLDRPLTAARRLRTALERHTLAERRYFEALPHFWCNPQRLQHIVDKMF